MSKSMKMYLSRLAFNWFPAYRATGGRVEYIAEDWREVRIRIPLTWRTRNYVGTIFGGSMFGAVDPVYMLMLIKLLGEDYEVWDKSASIRFRRPGLSTLRAVFRVEREELEAIRTDVAQLGKSERCYAIDLTDESGEVCATCEKLLSIRPRKARVRSSIPAGMKSRMILGAGRSA